jgi:hypothetical protein
MFDAGSALMFLTQADTWRQRDAEFAGSGHVGVLDVTHLQGEIWF